MRGAAVARADTVDQDPHLDTARAGGGEASRKRRPARVVIEDVGGEEDRARAAADGVEHRGVGGVAAFERRDAVAGERAGCR
jgi:hypothetical protein